MAPMAKTVVHPRCVLPIQKSSFPDDVRGYLTSSTGYGERLGQTSWHFTKLEDANRQRWFLEHGLGLLRREEVRYPLTSSGKEFFFEWLEHIEGGPLFWPWAPLQHTPHSDRGVPSANPLPGTPSSNTWLFCTYCTCEAALEFH